MRRGSVRIQLIVDDDLSNVAEPKVTVEEGRKSHRIAGSDKSEQLFTVLLALMAKHVLSRGLPPLMV